MSRPASSHGGFRTVLTVPCKSDPKLGRRFAAGDGDRGHLVPPVLPVPTSWEEFADATHHDSSSPRPVLRGTPGTTRTAHTHATHTIPPISLLPPIPRRAPDVRQERVGERPACSGRRPSPWRPSSSPLVRRQCEDFCTFTVANLERFFTIRARTAGSIAIPNCPRPRLQPRWAWAHRSRRREAPRSSIPRPPSVTAGVTRRNSSAFPEHHSRFIAPVTVGIFPGSATECHAEIEP